jgi:hypothetical protein
MLLKTYKTKSKLRLAFLKKVMQLFGQDGTDTNASVRRREQLLETSLADEEPHVVCIN